MATIKQGILGGLSGKIANVVGGSWKGINYLRSLPVSVANPRTTPQVTQRNKLSSSVRLAKQILASWIKPLFDRFAIQQSGYNVWVSENITLMDADGFVQPSNAVMAKGVMSAVPATLDNVQSGDTEVVVNWSTTLPDNQSSTNDLVYACVYNIATNSFVGVNAGVVLRSAGTLTIETDTVWGDSSGGQVFLAFRNQEGTKVSDSSTAQFNF